MSTPEGPLSAASLAELCNRIAAVTSPNPTLLIDGRSGAGKSTIAEYLVSVWPGVGDVQLVSMDDVYPGWNGLRLASQSIVEDILVPRVRGEAGRWRRYDWAAGEYVEWHRVDPARPLLIEGCGSLTRASADRADLRVWVDAPAAARKARALSRDGAMFAPQWDNWRLQEDALYAAEGSPGLADLIVTDREDAGGSHEGATDAGRSAEPQ